MRVVITLLDAFESLEVLSVGQGEGSSGGGAPRSGLDISQPPADCFCIVAEQHCCIQKAPLITSAKRALDPEPPRQEDKARLS